MGINVEGKNLTGPCGELSPELVAKWRSWESLQPRASDPSIWNCLSDHLTCARDALIERPLRL